jgi:hypothetical protein
VAAKNRVGAGAALDTQPAGQAEKGKIKNIHSEFSWLKPKIERKSKRRSFISFLKVYEFVLFETKKLYS